MDNTKRRFEKIAKLLIFIFICIFPLGQLLRLELKAFGFNFAFHPVDFVAFLTTPIFLIKVEKKHQVIRSIKAFLTVCLFSFVLSISYFKIKELFIGSLYLLRLFFYFSFFATTYYLVENNIIKRKTLFNSLIFISLIVGIFGLIQYIFFPDLRFLKYFGWDDHLYRLVGTFLDPGYTALILVFGFLLLIQSKDINLKLKILLSCLLLILISLTYSRASYFSLVAGILVLFLIRNISKSFFIFFTVLLLVSILFLPRFSSEGTRLERVASINARVENYKNTFEIFKQNPLIGVGFNNICQARIKISPLELVDPKSHSCSGSDSSILLIIATTGVLGLITFINLGIVIFRNLRDDVYGKGFFSLAISLLLNSFFQNSIFYPWVMGFFGILLSISIKDDKQV